MKGLSHHDCSIARSREPAKHAESCFARDVCASIHGVAPSLYRCGGMKQVHVKMESERGLRDERPLPQTTSADT